MGALEPLLTMFILVTKSISFNSKEKKPEFKEFEALILFLFWLQTHVIFLVPFRVCPKWLEPLPLLARAIALFGSSQLFCPQKTYLDESWENPSNLLKMNIFLKIFL